MCILTRKIHSLELRSEQLLIHLRELQKYHAEVPKAVTKLVAMQRQIATLKARLFKADSVLGFSNTRQLH